ncbi:MAG: TerB family tellurite resistance protein [Prevotellaceae bacterium]|nr:TerB family tellurite resistance protein [Candidatus Colivivens equi]
MADYNKLIGGAVGYLAGGVGGAIVGAFVAGDNEEEKDNRAKLISTWEDLANDLQHYRLQCRKCIMFLPDEDIDIIWNNVYAGDLEVVYLPYSWGVPDGITIVGNHLEEGVLYVYDPRNELCYYPANSIANVLISDKFTEIKKIFESLGATQIDITFSAIEDEKNEFSSNNNQKITGHYGEHKASIDHSGSRSGSSYTSNYRKLEIHKQCTGKKTSIKWSDCYWLQNDVILQNEVMSIESGTTIETNFVDTTQSYSSITSTRLDKVEAEYEYMNSIGVSGMIQWDKSTLQEIFQTLVWDIHLVFDNNNDNINESIMTNWKDYFEHSSDEFKCINSIWEHFNKIMFFVPDDIAQSDMEYFEELLHGDEEFDSMINVFKAIIGLTNESYYNEGKSSIQEALNLNDSLNYNDKYNLLLTYEAKEADCLEEFERIVSEFKDHRDNWVFVNRLFSYVVSTSLDDGGYTLDAYDEDADKKAIQTAYKAFRIKTNLPCVSSASDGWNDWISLCIYKNDDDAFYCSQTAYDAFRSLKPAIDHREASYRGTISYGMMGQIILGLAQCYHLGLGTEQNYGNAFRLFNEAYETIKKGDSPNYAIPHLAECYTLGHGTNVDFNKAVELYQEEIDNLQKTQSLVDPSSTIEDYRSKIKDIQSGKYNVNNNEVKRNVNSIELEYIEEYKCMLNDGEIGPRERKSLERLANKLGISAERANELENSLNSTSLSSEEQEYIEEYKSVLADGEIGPRERKSLERLAIKLGISQSRAEELEKTA